MDQALAERVRRRQPRVWPRSAYLWGWVQASLQLVVFAASVALLQSETRPLLVLALSMTCGWAWFCLLMVGHDAMHNAFAPSRSVNRLVAFLALDCLLFSRVTWLHAHHVVHHARPFSSEDGMFLRHRSVAGDMLHLLALMFRYLGADALRLVTKPRWDEWLGMCVRLTLFWILLPLALLPALLFLLLFGNYLGLLPHALPVVARTLDPVVRQLRTSWDLFPGSFLACLVTGGLNAHATHHVFPALPRGAQWMGSRILREEAGEEYRCVTSLADLWTLFQMRTHGTMVAGSVAAIVAGSIPASVGLIEALRNSQPDGTSARGRHADRRISDRRVAQVPIAFPDRRLGDRRGTGVRTAIS